MFFRGNAAFINANDNLGEIKSLQSKTQFDGLLSYFDSFI